MSAAQVVVRRERADQSDVVAALGSLDRYLRSLYPPEANHILEVHELLTSDVQFFVARIAGAVAGTGALRTMPGEAETNDEAYGEIKRMYVDPRWRGQRIGVQLVEAIEGALRDTGLSLALLETGCRQDEAVRLYRRCGYVLRPPFGGYPDNGSSLFYEKRLAP